MKRKHSSLAELDRSATDTTDIHPLSAALRREWQAVRRTGERLGPGRPRKDPRLKSRIVPISIDPKLLAQTDRYAKATGLTRSGLIAEGLKLRMKRTAPGP